MKGKSSRLKLNCQYCNITIWRYPCQIKIGEDKYCSKKCCGLDRRTINRNKRCKDCGKKIKYSSTYCVRHSQIGDRAPNWQGGKTRLTKRIRNRLWAFKWCKKVFKRDNWTCKQCGHHGGRLHAHHILSFVSFPKERFNINNGITLCEPCHKKIHYGSKNEQIKLVYNR